MGWIYIKNWEKKQFILLQRYYAYGGIIAFLLFLGILIAKISMENPVNLGVMIGALILSGVAYNLRNNHYLSIMITPCCQYSCRYFVFIAK